MACEAILRRLEAAARKIEEEKRRKAIREIETALATGQARIVKQPGGRMMIVGVPLPSGMMDTCVLAKLQERNSVGFKKAVAQANAQGMNFVHMHNLTHQGGGGHGH